jgi:hypothetical protein
MATEITVQTGEYTVGRPPTLVKPDFTCTLHYCEHGLLHSIGLRVDGKRILLDTHRTVVDTGGCSRAEIDAMRAVASPILSRDEIDGTCWPRVPTDAPPSHADQVQRLAPPSHADQVQRLAAHRAEHHAQALVLLESSTARHAWAVAILALPEVAPGQHAIARNVVKVCSETIEKTNDLIELTRPD